MPGEGARTVNGRLDPRGELALKRPWSAADLRERFAAGIDRLVYSKASQMLIDSILVAAALLMAYLLRFDGALPDPFPLQFERVLPIALLVYLSINLVTGVYDRVWRFFGLLDAAAVARSVFFVFALSFAWRIADPGVFAGTVVPIGVLVIHPFLVFAALVGARLVRRELYARTDARHQAARPGGSLQTSARWRGRARRGFTCCTSCGRPISRSSASWTMTWSCKAGRSAVSGCWGPRTTWRRWSGRTMSTKSSSACRAPHGAVLQRIVARCAGISVKASSVPTLWEIMSGSAAIGQLRPVKMEDLLGRHSAPPPAGPWRS